MDELALLRDFRLADADPVEAREHVRRAVHAAIARRRSRRRIVLALAFVAATVLAGAAYGIARELLVGDPAPEEITQQLARFGHEADLIPTPHVDDPIVDEARVAAVLESSAGRAYLFAVPNDRGPCGWVWIEGNRGSHGRPDMAGACGSAEQTFWAMGQQEFRGREVRLFWGRVGNGIARVTLRFDGGRTLALPLADGWFFAEFPAEIPAGVLAYDAGGRLVADGFHYRPPSERPPAGSPQPVPHQAGPARELLRIDARGGTEQIALEVAPASDGGSCMIVRSNRTPTNRGCSVPLPKPRELGVVAMQFGGAPSGVQLLVGPVGADVVRLRVRYEDGRVAELPLEEGWTLYEVERADYAAGRRPAELVGLDVAGEVVVTERLPWAR